jgi:hypothetical protein
MAESDHQIKYRKEVGDRQRDRQVGARSTSPESLPDLQVLSSKTTSAPLDMILSTVSR